MNYEIQNKESTYVIALLISQNIPRLLAQFDKIPKEQLPGLYHEINDILKRTGEMTKKSKEELTYSENAIIMGLTRNNKEFSKDTLLMFYETLEEIESLGIDLTPNPVKPQNSIIKREVNTESEPVPNKNVALLAEAFYETTENDRSKLMAEIIDLGHRSQPTSENKNIESKKEER